MKDILVSIVIPIYNRTSDLEVLLTSIINNEYRNYEVIIVDNASTENITYVIDKFKMDIHYIRLNENKMAAGGRNAGAEIARGKYICFIDSDNIIDSKMLNSLVECMEMDDSIGLCGPVMYYYRSKEELWYAGNDINRITSQTKYFKDVDRLRNMPNIFETDHIPNLMFTRRELFAEVGGYDESYYIMYEEADFAEKIRRKGYKIVVCRNATTYHNVLLPSENLNEMRKLGIETPLRAYHFCKNRNIYMKRYGGKIGKILYFMFFRFLFGLYYIYISLKNKRIDVAKMCFKGMIY